MKRVGAWSDIGSMVCIIASSRFPIIHCFSPSLRHATVTDHSQGCCIPFPLQHENEACFITHPSSSTTLEDGRCIDPVPLFEDQTKQRCLSHTTCNAFHAQDNIKTITGTEVVEKGQVQICVKPHSSAGLLRITFLKDADDAEENIIVWKGPRREVWEQGARPHDMSVK